MLITKKSIEDLIGFEIKDFKIEPLLNGTDFTGLSINVTPIAPIEKIIINLNKNIVK